MRKAKIRFVYAIALLAVFLPGLDAEDRRSIPMDFYLVIDGSEAFQGSKAAAIAWLSERVVDRLLLDGDTVTVWAAGDRAERVFSGAVSGGKDAIKDKLKGIASTGKSADFSGALRSIASGMPGSQDRLSYTMLVTASAGALESALARDTQGHFRWFRSEKYEKWQVLVVAPDIGRKVSNAAAAYMNSLRR